MRNRIGWLIVGLIVGAVLYYFSAPYLPPEWQPPSGPPLYDDERPPIIVEEGSLKFTLEKANGKAKWTKKNNNDGSKWHPKQANAESLTTLIVSNTAGSGTGCTLSGTEVTITFSEGGNARPYKVMLENEDGGAVKELVVIPYQPSGSEANDVLEFPVGSQQDAGITKVEVNAVDPCNFAAAEKPRLRIEYR